MIYQLVPEKCIACGLCQVLAPDIFDYTPDGIVIFSDDPSANNLIIPAEFAEQGMSAYRECPTRAIEIRR